MNFRKRTRDEPEINLIPFIDVLLVVVIFLMLSTTYSKFTELQVNLPVANTDAARDYPKEIIVAANSDGRHAINQNVIQSRSLDALATALLAANPASKISKNSKDRVLIISDDATASHQSVILAMAAARRVDLSHITLATQSASGKP
jgi:biopolymer transport protein ExbD